MTDSGLQKEMVDFSSQSLSGGHTLTILLQAFGVYLPIQVSTSVLEML